MRKKFALATTGLLMFGLASGVQAAVLYDNVPGPTDSVFSSGSSPRTGGADEVFIAGSAAQVTSMQFGYLVATGGPAAFDAHIQFFDDINGGATTGPQFSNLLAD